MHITRQMRVSFRTCPILWALERSFETGISFGGFFDSRFHTSFGTLQLRSYTCKPEKEEYAFRLKVKSLQCCPYLFGVISFVLCFAHVLKFPTVPRNHMLVVPTLVLVYGFVATHHTNDFTLHHNQLSSIK